MASFPIFFYFTQLIAESEFVVADPFNHTFKYCWNHACGFFTASIEAWGCMHIF